MEPVSHPPALAPPFRPPSTLSFGKEREASLGYDLGPNLTGWRPRRMLNQAPAAGTFGKKWVLCVALCKTLGPNIWTLDARPQTLKSGPWTRPETLNPGP